MPISCPSPTMTCSGATALHSRSRALPPEMVGACRGARAARCHGAVRMGEGARRSWSRTPMVGGASPRGGGRAVIGPGRRQAARPASNVRATQGEVDEDLFLPDPTPRDVRYTVISVDDHVVEPPHTFEGRRPETVKLEPFRFDQMRPGCYDVEARVRDMDVNGVWASVN